MGMLPGGMEGQVTDRPPIASFQSVPPVFGVGVPPEI